MQEPETQDGRWRITDRASAFWAMRQLAKARARIDENKQLAADEMKRIDRWLYEENKPWARTAEFFERHLEAYHRQLLAEDPKAKTVKTPFGTFALRAQAPEWRYNEAGLLAWLKTNRPDLIRVTEEPDKAALKKAVALVVQEDETYLPVLAETGEQIEGVAVVDRPPAFSVKVEPEEVPGL
jgi:hypothetical protein